MRSINKWILLDINKKDIKLFRITKGERSQTKRRGVQLIKKERHVFGEAFA